MLHPLTAYGISTIPLHMIQREGKLRMTCNYYGRFNVRVRIITFMDVLSCYPVLGSLPAGQ